MAPSSIRNDNGFHSVASMLDGKLVKYIIPTGHSIWVASSKNILRSLPKCTESELTHLPIKFGYYRQCVPGFDGVVLECQDGYCLMTMGSSPALSQCYKITDQDNVDRLDDAPTAIPLLFLTSFNSNAKALKAIKIKMVKLWTSMRSAELHDCNLNMHIMKTDSNKLCDELKKFTDSYNKRIKLIDDKIGKLESTLKHPNQATADCTIAYDLYTARQELRRALIMCSRAQIFQFEINARTRELIRATNTLMTF